MRIAIGHSEATPEVIRDAVAAGATLSTHLGNGCSAMLPRHPNLIWEQLAADDLLTTLIVDGHHLPAATVKAMIRVKSPRRTILISDAIAAAGCPPGADRLGDVYVVVGIDRRVSLRGTPYLAGSALTLPEAIGNTVRFTGLPIQELLMQVLTIPAEYLGISTEGTVVGHWDAESCRFRSREGGVIRGTATIERRDAEAAETRRDARAFSGMSRDRWRRASRGPNRRWDAAGRCAIGPTDLRRDSSALARLPGRSKPSGLRRLVSAILASLRYSSRCALAVGPAGMLFTKYWRFP